VEEMKKGFILFYGFWVPDIFTGVKEAVGIGAPANQTIKLATTTR
jgi:hypothetical protein